jgi:TolA-binding protein
MNHPQQPSAGVLAAPVSAARTASRRETHHRIVTPGRTALARGLVFAASAGFRRGLLGVVVIAVVLAMPAAAPGQQPDGAAAAGGRRPVRQRETKGEGGGYAALQLLRKGQELIDSGEHDRGTKILETIIEQYPNDPIRFKAHLALGKHALARSEQMEAIGHLRNLKALEQPGAEMDAETRELFLEGLYLQGIAYFQTRQYAQAFPLLRRITNDFPKTVWANQSYYYIGMCHFAQGNWNKAIEALGLVGTFVDDKSGAVEYAEAGRRFYVKIEDTDLPVLEKLGQEVRVKVSAASGDSEMVALVPLPGDDKVSIGSVATALGTPHPGDDVLQVVGGDTIRTTYIDGTTLDGQKDVDRSREVKVVSSAALMFTRGDYESQAVAAFMGQPVFVVLFDADLDTSAKADAATIRVMARFKEELDDDEKAADARTGVDIEKILRSEEDSWRTRDEIRLTLGELQAAVAAAEAAAETPAPSPADDSPGDAVHTGRFGGRFDLAAFVEDQPVDQADGVLTVAVGDEIVATWVDELNIAGPVPRTVTARTIVASEIDSKPRAVQYEVGDPVVAAKKNLVEAAAFLELGRIFKAMGLMKGAVEKVGEGITRIEPIIRQSGAIPASLTEEAFRTKWELHIVADDFNAAIQTCELFNRLYPESPFVDRALLQIGRIKEESRKPQEAIAVYLRILNLPASQIKPEAQFRIAQATEKLEGNAAAEQAIVQYKLCAERYPDSPFAGESLGKLVDYHIEKKDNTAANDLLEQIFQDYPDAQFLDAMLLKWVVVAYRTGDFQKAYDKCTQLLFEYPASPYAERARATLPKIEQKVKPAADKAADNTAATQK